jgi:hypothetical protein
MATRVIEDSDTEVVHHDHGGNYGLVIGLVVLLLVVLLVIFYGLPYLRGLGTASVNVPDKINVNVNGTAK